MCTCGLHALGDARQLQPFFLRSSHQISCHSFLMPHQDCIDRHRGVAIVTENFTGPEDPEKNPEGAAGAGLRRAACRAACRAAGLRRACVQGCVQGCVRAGLRAGLRRAALYIGLHAGLHRPSREVQPSDSPTVPTDTAHSGWGTSFTAI